jgi:two-component system KDP operon response regulator KdpE
MAPKIIIVDDDETMNELVRVNLQPRGYEMISVTNGRRAIEIVRENNPDLVILDVMMPEMDGFEVCKALREFTDVPVLFLTAKGREQDLVRGFEVGGDDYVRKPFSLRELEARIQALLKRAVRVERDRIITQFNDGNLRIDLESGHVYRAGKMVHLTPTEFRLLKCLVHNIGMVITHEDLLRDAWGENYTDATASLSLYIRYLREKIEDDPSLPRYIMTKWGIGYWFADTGSPTEKSDNGILLGR